MINDKSAIFSTLIATLVISTTADAQTRLSAVGNQFWSQESTEILSIGRQDEMFGAAIASGDFNDDGFIDMAVGAPRDDVTLGGIEGAVNVIYGSAGGLTPEGNQLWHQSQAGVAGTAETQDEFGSAVATGDFNGDGYADLAIGAWQEAIGDLFAAGAVNVLYGSASGLTAAGDELWYEDVSGVIGSSEAGDRYGWALATGDFNGDGHSDIAISVYNQDVGGVISAGAVNILYGSADGLKSEGNQLWHQDVDGIQGVASFQAHFGQSLAVGDFNNDNRDDLVIGVNDDIGDADKAGAVNVIYGSDSGLAIAGNQYWHQDSPGIGGVAEAFDGFGATITAGDFDGDTFADMAVSAAGEDIEGKQNAGSVNVLYGSVSGLAFARNQLWHQDVAGVISDSEANETFGTALTSGDFSGDGKDDLAIGIQFEIVEGATAWGAVHVLYGSGTGLSTTGNQLWHQDVAGLPGVGEYGDSFGWSLATGDFNGDGFESLTIGIEGDKIGDFLWNAGAVQVLNRALDDVFKDSFELP